jgi:malonate transporter and related proteins
MFTTLMVVLPIFALILVGYGCRRTGVLGPNATTELNRFVVYLALPALLFDIMAHTSWAAIYQPGFIATFGLSCAIVFAVTVALRLRTPLHLADASIDGLNAAYANCGFIGFPLCLILFGRSSLTATTIAAILTVCVLFALAIVLIEIGLQTEARPAHLALKVGRSLIKNPLLVAPVLGALVAASGVGVPSSAEIFLKLLGNAASPCALVALGLFLGQPRSAGGQGTGASLLLVGLKLILHPATAWVLARYVFDLSPFLTHVAVVLAALPTGTGPFMLAEFYGREATVTANAILLSTIGALITISAYLAWAT